MLGYKIPSNPYFNALKANNRAGKKVRKAVDVEGK
jgi:hypothetical protein